MVSQQVILTVLFKFEFVGTLSLLTLPVSEFFAKSSSGSSDVSHLKSHMDHAPCWLAGLSVCQARANVPLLPKLSLRMRLFLVIQVKLPIVFALPKIQIDKQLLITLRFPNRAGGAGQGAAEGLAKGMCVYV